MRARLLACIVTLGMTACDAGTETPDTHESAQPQATPERGAADHGHGVAESNLEPLPLLPIMQKLGADMTALTHALMTDDFAGVTAAAAAIAEHAPIAPSDFERIRSALGQDMAAFEELDQAVHAASVRLHDAAESRQTEAVLQELHEVQTGCVACHQRFRERLVATRNR